MFTTSSSSHQENTTDTRDLRDSLNSSAPIAPSATSAPNPTSAPLDLRENHSPTGECADSATPDLKRHTNTNREMILTVATGGICLALSFVLSQIRLFSMPQGGSITPASMLPIFFFALCFGAKKGYAVAFLFSLLQLFGGYFVHPAQILLDYILAFTALGTAGLFAAPVAKRLAASNPLDRLKMVPFWRIILAVILSCALRCLGHVLAGVIFFAEYAGEQNVWAYSIAYNGSFIATEAGITCALLVGISAGLGILHKK